MTGIPVHGVTLFGIKLKNTVQKEEIFGMSNKDEYERLCLDEPSICIYDQPWWMDAVCGAENWDVLLYKKGEQIIGAMPYYVKKKFGLQYITQPEFTQHNGVWIKYPQGQSEMKRLSLEKNIFSYFIEQMEKLPIAFYQQNFSPSVTNWQPYYWKKYKQSTNYTYRLPDISDPEKLFKSFHPDKRQNIKRARNNNFQFKLDLPANQFYDLHQKNLEKRGGTIGYSRELFYQIYDAAYAHDSGCTAYLEDEHGNVAGAIFNIWDKRWGYDLITAFDPDLRNTGAADFLVFNMLQFFSDKTKGYDFEGSMIEGVEESFRHFGATQTPYFSIHKTYTRNPLIRAVIQCKLN